MQGLFEGVIGVDDSTTWYGKWLGYLMESDVVDVKKLY